MKITTRDDCEIFEHLEFETGSAIGARARIGLVVLATDYTVEHEFRRIINVPGVDIYQARIRNEPTITPETLAAIGPLLTDTAALILPGIADTNRAPVAGLSSTAAIQPARLIQGSICAQPMLPLRCERVSIGLEARIGWGKGKTERTFRPAT